MLIDDIFEDEYFDERADEYVNAVLNHYRSASGKRVRSGMILSVLDLRARAQGAIPEDAFAKAQVAGEAVELLHTATLIHDDIIDNATHRREIESLNAKYGANVALVAGDVVLSRALAKMSELKDGYTVSQMLKVVQRLCEGQMRESAWQETGSKPSSAELLQVLREKTGALFGLAARLGAYFALLQGIASKQDVQDLDEMARAGELYGVAFQLRDDLEDITEDRTNGVISYPLLFGEKASFALAERLEHESGLISL